MDLHESKAVVRLLKKKTHRKQHLKPLFFFLFCDLNAKHYFHSRLYTIGVVKSRHAKKAFALRRSVPFVVSVVLRLATLLSYSSRFVVGVGPRFISFFNGDDDDFDERKRDRGGTTLKRNWIMMMMMMMTLKMPSSFCA